MWKGTLLLENRLDAVRLVGGYLNGRIDPDIISVGDDRPRGNAITPQDPWIVGLELGVSRRVRQDTIPGRWNGLWVSWTGYNDTIAGEYGGCDCREGHIQGKGKRKDGGEKGSTISDEGWKEERTEGDGRRRRLKEMEDEASQRRSMKQGKGQVNSFRRREEEGKGKREGEGRREKWEGKRGMIEDKELRMKSSN
ncbi:hypothetical protein BJ684DRAFT_14690 [Piptocephalis cylindrospora]|uniref:Uncharacterized protein n=1 Tax=Piptocephalis cylindrospora TaxID=1907219 RepID=A0A4P9YAB5_9FUNG|nr:hypothetical protein BJ684DRAFT_14690 [Piptocephalis cylindrospora]|eukprot:RKP15010.1 hypothetical protein BJ684DRAFT_14690 [Piptocephalis cylindrospora]